METRLRMMAAYGLAILPMLAFAGSYYEIAKSNHEGYSNFWLFGSALIVTIVSGVLFGFLSTKELPMRMAASATFGLVVGGIYTYAIFFVVLNTLGS